MSKLIEQIVSFKDKEDYTSFLFQQWLEETPPNIRMILTDFHEGIVNHTECTLEFDQWEYLAHRILDMVEHQRKVING